MPRIEFWAPDEELILDQVMVDVLGLVGVTVPVEAVYPWTPNERLMAYDWAMRHHFRASDNIVRMRPRPSFILAEWGGTP